MKNAFKLAATIMLLVPYSVFAIELDPIVVTATRSEQPEIITPTYISIISSDTIKNSGASLLTEVLRSHGGVQVADTFGDGNQSIVSMRGMGETGVSNVLILVDGRPLNNPDISAPDLNSVSVKDILRIEIMKGSAGSLFGDQAVGGVINIITRTPTDFNVRGRVGFGGFDQTLYQASISDVFDNGFGYRFSVEENQSDGYRDDNDNDRSNYFGRINFDHASGAVFAEYLKVDNVLSSRAALSGSQVNADRQQAAGFILVDSETEVKRLGIEQDIFSYFKLMTEYTDRDFDNESPSESITFGVSQTDINRRVKTYTPRIQGHFDTTIGPILITVGGDVEEEEFGFGNQSVGGLFGDSSFQNDQQRDRYSYYFQGTFPLVDGLTTTLGIRHAHIDAEFSGSAESIFGQSSLDAEFDDSVTVKEIGFMYQASDNLKVYIRRDENFRFAKTDELADVFRGFTPLKTQEGTSYELGIEWWNDMVLLSAFIYQLEIQNEIGTVTDNFGFVSNVNFDDTRRRGVDLEARLYILPNLSLTGQYSYVDAEFIEGLLDGNELPFVSSHLFSFYSIYSPVQGLSLFGEMVYTGSRYSQADILNAQGKRGGYTVWNANVAYTHGAWTIAGRVNNITNKKYSEITTFAPFLPGNIGFSPSPERNFLVTLSIDLDSKLQLF